VLDPLAGGALAVACRQQLALVQLALGGVEDHRPHHSGGALGAREQDGVDQDRQPVAARRHDVDSDLADGALEPQHRRVVRLVVDPAARAEQVLEPLDADELLAPVPRPAQERRVHPDEHPFRRRREVAAGRVLEEILEVTVLLRTVHADGVRRTPGSLRSSPAAR
jgi:hypothetical protein